MSLDNSRIMLELILLDDFPLALSGFSSGAEKSSSSPFSDPDVKTAQNRNHTPLPHPTGSVSDLLELYALGTTFLDEPFRSLKLVGLGLGLMLPDFARGEHTSGWSCGGGMGLASETLVGLEGKG